MKTCFVIQRFDDGVFDKRYRETFAPAIERAGAKAIRADEVLGTRPVIEKIEQSLHAADVAFAEISEDNPNVFLELGIALALGVPTVIVCDKSKRERIPFDIAHRPVTFYGTASRSDWDKLSKVIEQGIAAALLEARTSIAPMTEGQEDKDIDDVKGACLTTLLDQSLRSPVGAALWEIQRELSSAQMTNRMVALAVASLLHDKLIQQHELQGEDRESYNTFSLSEAGQKHLLRSYSQLMHSERELVRATSVTQPKAITFGDDLDDDIPF